MARVEIQNTANTIDWNGDFDLTDSGFSQDVNFDGVLSGGNNSLHGFNDWNSLRLDLTGAGESAAGLSQGSLRLGTGLFILLPDGSGSSPMARKSWPMARKSWPMARKPWPMARKSWPMARKSWPMVLYGWPMVLYGWLTALNSWPMALDSWPMALDSWPMARKPWPMAPSSWMQGIQEHTTEHFADIGHSPPRELTGCVIGADCAPSAPSSPLHRTFLQWKTPTAANVAGGGILVGYHVFRARGREITASSVIFQLTTAPVTGLTYVDTEELPNNIDFVYYVKAVWDDGSTSFASNNAIAPNGNPYITAVNDAPVAVADAGPIYTTVQKALRSSCPNRVLLGVLGNDTDVDSPATSLSAVRVVPPWFRCRRITH